MELGQEVASENEAMVESFRVGGSFAVVTEWKAQVDLATGVPVIKKEAVKSTEAEKSESEESTESEESKRNERKGSPVYRQYWLGARGQSKKPQEHNAT